MYRILKCDKDSYITNKVIKTANPALTGAVDANVGQAGTIDLFKIRSTVTSLSSSVYVTSSRIESSRALLHFNLDPLRAITGSILDFTHPSFKCVLKLSDIYGGQTTPSNYSLALYPLAKEFSEGRGMDVVGFQDLDAVNWLTA